MQTIINNINDMPFIIKYAICECCSFLLQKEFNILYLKLKQITLSKRKLQKMATIWENPYL
jgi:hypothetical protein